MYYINLIKLCMIIALLLFSVVFVFSETPIWFKSFFIIMCYIGVYLVINVNKSKNQSKERSD